MKNQKYQDNLAKNLAISGESETFFAQYQAEKLAQWLPDEIDQNIAILDFGCGDGLMTSFVLHLFENATITGIDTDPERIALAKDMYNGINFICSDLETEQLLDLESFDVIYTTEVFHHLPSKKHELYIARLMQLLKPGGKLIIFELNPLNPATLYRFTRNPLEHNARLIMPWRLRRLLASYGWARVRYYNFNLPTRKIEPYLTWFPFGGLYAVIILKK